MTEAVELPWIGEFKSEWRVVPNKAVIKPKKQSVGIKADEYDLLSLTKQGVIVRNLDEGGKFPENFDSYQRVEPGDLVTCLFDVEETPRTIGISKHSGMITGAYDVFEFKGDVNPRFFEYFYLALDQRKGLKYFYSGLRNVIRTPVFLSIPMPLPPRAEQDAIVEFLDMELQEIDELQVRNTRLLQQLNMRRESLISSYVEDKRTDWPRVPLKYEVGLNPDVLPEDTDPNEILHYIEIGDVNLEQGISGFTPVAFSEAPSRARRIVRNGDVLISTVRTYLKAIGQVRESQSENKSVASTGFAVLRPNRIEPRFLKYAVSSDTFIQNIQAYSTGISYPAINASQLVKFKIPVPPFAIQVEIADSLDRKLASIDKLQKQTTKLVFTLQERRSSIISSAVTGQIDFLRRA